MSDDETALVRAIQASPDEDTLRLMYADWLDEHGTTDQHRARSEWIKLTCDDRRAEAAKSTGSRKRKAGEPDWLRANAHRLWPNLTARLRLPPGGGGVTLLTGTVIFRVRTGKQGGEVVTVVAERGVATSSWFAFLAASRVAPVLAADDPLVPMSLSVPQWALRDGHSGFAVAYFERFRDHGLADAWRLIPSDDMLGGYGKVLFEYRDRDRPQRIVSDAITQWARGHAANPLTGLKEEAA